MSFSRLEGSGVHPAPPCYFCRSFRGGRSAAAQVSPALGVGSYYAPTSIFPWQLPAGSPFPNGIAFTIGVLAFGFIALKLIADLVDGRASLRSSGPALLFNAALILFAPLLVWVTVTMDTITSRRSSWRLRCMAPASAASVHSAWRCRYWGTTGL